MTIAAQSIIRRATDILQDKTSIRWPANELVRWLNDAQREIIKKRPDAMNTTATMSLVAGTRQDLDSATANSTATAALAPLPAKLIDITRNMAGNLRSVTKVERKVLDVLPSWHDLAGSISIQHFTFDAKDPKTFYVYPPALSTSKLEVMYSAYPTDVTEPADGADYTAVTGNLSVPDIYANDVLDLVLSRAYSKDSEFAGNAQLAGAYAAKADSSLKTEIAATVAVQPVTK